MAKVICVIGVTGNQGGSVALRFNRDERFKVRGLTRSPTGEKAKELAAQGIKIVQADLNDVGSLERAFAGVNVIFSVTQYWEPFFRPDCRQEAAAQGISCRKYAFDVELQQGRNIADAAATTVDTLEPNGFLVSTLCHAEDCSNGMFKELYHFDGKAEIFPKYVKEKHPALAAKMSCIHTGFFMTSYKLAPQAYFAKQADGSFQMSFTTAPETRVPHLDVNRDTGNFVYAVSQRPPGGQYMARSDSCSWSEFMRIWSEFTGHAGTYKQVTLQELIANSPDKEFGREIGDMFTFCNDPGYDGGMDLLTAEELRKAGIECPMTSLRDFISQEDWTTVIA